MDTAITKLEDFVNALLTHENRPFYLVVDAALRAISWQGEGDRYGFENLAKGQALDDELALLSTLERSDGRIHQWRFVHRPGGVIAHLHVISMTDGWAIAMLDASMEHDFTQARQQAAHELKLLQEKQEQLIAELAEANRLKSLFIGRMSHEFRTPLSSIIGYAELMGNDSNPRYVSAVSRSARYLSNLVDNLLDQARGEEEETPLQTTACDLQEIAMEVEEMFRPIANTRDLSLAWWFDADVPTRVWADGTRLRQILINLVGNAIKFTREGGVSIDFSREGERVGISVSDTGRGIPPAEHENVFKPYAQGADQRHGRGAGLGLTITRTLVRQMGGDLTLESEPDKGSTFSFALPLDEVKGTKPQDTRYEGLGPILVADENPDQLELLRLYLANTGLEVVTAMTEDQVIKQSRKKKPAAILLDEQFGRQGSVELAARLREKGYHGPVICLSTNDEHDEEAYRLFDAHWRKPVGRDLLLTGLNTFLSRDH